MSSYDIQFWSIRKKARRRRPYEVRWVVNGRECSRSFITKPLAESFRSELMKAARDGEPFDETSGLPVRKANDARWLEHACSYVDMKWPKAAAKSRISMAEALTTATMALFEPRRGRPDDEVLRRALYGWAFNSGRRGTAMPAEVREALVWANAASMRLSALRSTATVRRLLDALAVKLDGKPAAATTTYRKRAVVYNALGYAVELEILPANPIDRVQWKAPEVASTVDRRVVANPEQVRRLLAAVRQHARTGRRLVAFFACMYFAGLRPSEALDLRRDNCYLPKRGWGRIDLTTTDPSAGTAWTDDGRARERRGLKRRGRNEVRPVPIPPELVRHLRHHIEWYGTASDGRLFRTSTGGTVPNSHYSKLWQHARAAALTPTETASPLAGRPYDLRHAAASLWLNAGVVTTEVARRLGHSVAVLLQVYANCIDGQGEAANKRIEAALSDQG
ncbi:site-specific integrase [Virgisporangium aliadipatigenens]|uniref:Site-specific integrase n=1 Tax=Virgisporangium aliadipatigenens TaxID=741659 RepID=A0A8J3YHW2_9ACTN|nr:tyrosine-type recombinase/integrase [Virgisporangium aliadipatigenens]GIJ44508.1 site-specific integrase [Virgisporangium aliadipatigenens]